MHKRSVLYSNSIARLLLAIIWILGILLGLYIAVSLPDNSRQIVAALTQSRVSVVSIIGCFFVPVILSAIVWKVKYLALFFVLAFLKAVCYGFCFCTIGHVFRDAGWLLRWLFLFSDSCSSALLLWFWYRNITPMDHRVTKDLFICGIISAGVILFDICYVIPFCQRLF